MRPCSENLKFEVLAWTPSTNGTVTGSAIQVELPQGPPAPVNADAAAAGGGRGLAAAGRTRRRAARLGPTKEEMDRWVADTKAKVRGKIVLIGKAAVIPVNFDPPQKRRDDEQVKAQYDPANPGGGRGRGGFGGGRGRGNPDPNRLTATPGERSRGCHADFRRRRWCASTMRARGDGLIVAQQHRAYDPAKTIPTVILRNDDYGRIERLLADGDDVKLEFTHRQPRLSRGQNQLQRGRRNPGHATRPMRS